MNTDEQPACLEPAETNVARCVFFSAKCVCVIVPSQEIPDGGGTAEGKTVMMVGLDSVPVCLLTYVCPTESETERC